MEHCVEQIVDLFNQLADGHYHEWKTTRGNTQQSERDYTEIFAMCIEECGFQHNQAASQKPKDFHIYTETGELDIELKKVNTKNGGYMLNDTLPDDDTFYVFINVERETTIFMTGKEMKGEQYQELAEYNKSWKTSRRSIAANSKVRSGTFTPDPVLLSTLIGDC